jgi:hypothetical protein
MEQSKNNNMTIQFKINPRTGRKITVGGKVWKSLTEEEKKSSDVVETKYKKPSILSVHSEFLKNLREFCPEIVDSLIEYTNSSAQINTELRTGILSPPVRRIVENIDFIFDMVEPITKDVILYRGVNNRDHIISTNAFISTTHKKSLSYLFKIMLTIPAGSKVLFIESISKYRWEKEVLVSRKGTMTLQGNSENQFFVKYEPSL